MTFERSRSARRGSALVPGALLGWLLLAAPAAPARAEPAAEERGPAFNLIADAVAEYDAGRFEEARALFRRAHEQSPSARTLRGIGMASFELRDYVEAIHALEAALPEQRHPLTPEQRRHVDGLLARAQTFVGRFTVRLRPAGASLLVDGKPARPEPDGTLLLPFGHHQMVAGCPSCAPERRELEVVGGERQDLDIALEPTPAPLALDAAARSPAPRAAGGAPPRDSGEPPENRSRTGYWLGGTAAVAAAGGVACALWWRDRARELDRCQAAGARCQNQGTVTQERSLATGATIGLAAVALASGIAAVILWPRRGGATTQALGCATAGGEVLCAIRF